MILSRRTSSYKTVIFNDRSKIQIVASNITAVELTGNNGTNLLFLLFFSDVIVKINKLNITTTTIYPNSTPRLKASKLKAILADVKLRSLRALANPKP